MSVLVFFSVWAIIFLAIHSNLKKNHIFAQNKTFSMNEDLLLIHW